ncbi:MAG: 50S ribosomal protein L6 [Blastocatellia bacterium]|nr:50S ribosomal protein L6 [Blastocatellia bacterium]
MSRVGKKEIELPKDVKVEISSEIVQVTGPKGVLKTSIPNGISVKVENNAIKVESKGNDFAALYGLTRALLANSVTGVTKGFTRQLDIVGVGYRVELDRSKVNDAKKPVRAYSSKKQSSGQKSIIFDLGYSHMIDFPVPEGIDFRADKIAGKTIPQYQTTLTLSGIDRQILGQVAADMHNLRKPDAYKGKGVRYAEKVLKLKPGKTGK